jgi:protoheme IX farnesyltransferase
VALLPLSLCPFLLGLAGQLYLLSASVLGASFIWCAVQFARQLSLARARQLFYLSLIYLPVLLVALVVDKVK